MVMKERRMLETVFAPKGITIRWHSLASDADQTRSMAAGSLDIASVINSASVILANAEGKRMDIAALVGRPRQNFALMVGANGPMTIKDLKGKTIAGPKETFLYQMLEAALAKEGMSLGDLNFVQAGLAEAGEALLSGQADAALQAGSLIVRNEEAGARVLFTSEAYLTPFLFTAVRPDFAKQWPDILKVYLDTQAAAYDWIAANPRETVAIICRHKKITEEDGTELFQWSGIASVMDIDELSAVRADVDFLYKQGMITVRVNPENFILSSTYSR
jgi:ABC-type nitrate/sulfonate/bicarbonate transport system substrate-binding protein